VDVEELISQSGNEGFTVPSLVYTRRGRSQARHVRYRETDIERAKNWEPGHVRRSKGEARRAEPTFRLCFVQRR